MKTLMDNTARLCLTLLMATGTAFVLGFVVALALALLP